MAARRKRTRRTSGSGSVYEDKQGQLFAAVTVEGRRIVRRARSRTHANEIIEQLLREGAPFRADEKLTLGEWVAEWLKEVERSSKKKTWSDYRTVLKHATELHAVLLPRLTVRSIDRIIDGIGGTRAKEKFFVTLRRCLNRAVERKLLESNPMDTMIKPRHVAEEIDPFNDREQRLLLGSVELHRLGAAVGVSLICGLRIGEVLGLQWSDWLDDELSIQRQVQAVEGPPELVSPKSRAGTRRIPLPESLQAMLHARKVIALKEGQAGNAQMFPAVRGGLMAQQNFRNRFWNPLLKQLGIRHRGFHHCRHTAATEMLTRGVPVHAVARILGHGKPSVTLNMYAHWVPQNQDQARSAMQAAWHSASG